MKKNNWKKFFAVTGLTFLIGNIIYIVLNLKKAKELDVDYDVTVTFDKRAIDMSKEDSKVSVGSMFSAATLDYSNAPILDEPYELELYAMFTGIEIIVPEDWYVEAKGKIAMAGIDNKTYAHEEEGPRLKIQFSARFAGISIKNL